MLLWQLQSAMMDSSGRLAIGQVTSPLRTPSTTTAQNFIEKMDVLLIHPGAYGAKWKRLAGVGLANQHRVKGDEWALGC